MLDYCSDEYKKYKILILDTIITLSLMIFVIVDKSHIKGIDLYLCWMIIGLLVFYLIGRYFENKSYIACFHFVWACFMVVIPLITTNTFLLMVHLLVSLFTIFTRKMFDGCIVRTLEKEDNTITNNNFTNHLNWDIIFPVLAMISTAKLIYYRVIPHHRPIINNNNSSKDNNNNNNNNKVSIENGGGEGDGRGGVG